MYKRQVEGQENPISECWNYGFYDVNPYWIKSNHVYSQDCFFMDKTFFDGLPADIQELAAKAADEASSWPWAPQRWRPWPWAACP